MTKMVSTSSSKAVCLCILCIYLKKKHGLINNITYCPLSLRFSNKLIESAI